MVVLFNSGDSIEDKIRYRMKKLILVAFRNYHLC